MRLSPLFSRPRVAPEPHGANSTDTTPSIADASTQHPLSQAPKSAVAQGTPKSHRGMLASARKSLASLRKQLPLMCMSSATLKAVENPPRARSRCTGGRPASTNVGSRPCRIKQSVSVCNDRNRSRRSRRSPRCSSWRFRPSHHVRNNCTGSNVPSIGECNRLFPKKCAVTRRSCRSPARWHRSCRPRPSSRDRQWPLRAPSSDAPPPCAAWIGNWQR